MPWLIAIGSLATAVTGTMALWGQVNWMTYGGAHDFVMLGPLLSFPCAVVAALGLIVALLFRRERGVALCCAALALCFALVVPLLVQETTSRVDWLTAYPSRLPIFVSAVVFGGLSSRLWWSRRQR